MEGKKREEREEEKRRRKVENKLAGIHWLRSFQREYINYLSEPNWEKAEKIKRRRRRIIATTKRLENDTNLNTTQQKLKGYKITNVKQSKAIRSR